MPEQDRLADGMTPAEKADPNCPRCRGKGTVKEIRQLSKTVSRVRRLLPCPCTQRDR